MFVRGGIEKTLEERQVWVVCGEATNRQEAVDLVLELSPNLVVPPAPSRLQAVAGLGLVREQQGRLRLAFLPTYAPELTPVEYLWSHWKQHELPNFCAQTFWQTERSVGKHR